ncbi:MAG: ATP-binding cassette domain-containing protein [Candidatus Altiarchaeota archaeon]
MMPQVLRLQGVSKDFGDGRLALDRVDWTVNGGEHWVVLGLNGSGKTTILRIASGRLWPTSGDVSILGKMLGSVDLRSLRRSIGWVSSALSTRMPPGLSAIDVVKSGRFDSVGLYEETGEGEENDAKRQMRLMGCMSVASKRFGTLSQGEAQRVLIARALLAAPRLLVLDEPCIGLDMKARESFLESVGRLTGSGLTVLFVTHHLEEIISEFTHVLLMKDGRVMKAGPKGEVVSSENLSNAFELSLDLECRSGRYYVRI